jgi:phosphatidylglycerophosphatase A
MAIKESSDELNPTVATRHDVPKPRAERTPKDYLALAIATCGVGYLPLAPGTWASLVMVGIYLTVRAAWIASGPNPSFAGFLGFQLGLAIAVTVLGVWAASRSERALQLKDPSKVVIDEVAGQSIALMAVPFTLATPTASIITAFILFRFFDIVKPYPARKFESLHGGVGIMADDLIAGLYAAVVLLVVAKLI